MECFCRRNQDLEQDSVSYQAQKVQAEIAASAMAERLQAVLQDKFRPSSTAFDSDTPIDKALSFLQSYIQVVQTCLRALRVPPLLWLVLETASGTMVTAVVRSRSMDWSCAY